MEMIERSIGEEERSMTGSFAPSLPDCPAPFRL